MSMLRLLHSLLSPKHSSATVAWAPQVLALVYTSAQSQLTAQLTVATVCCGLIVSGKVLY